VRIKKAVITAAGRGNRLFPAADTVQKGMLPLVDRDGVCKPVLQIIAEDALDSGVEEICVVCAPGDDAAYKRLFGCLRDNLVEAYKGVDWAQSQASRIDNLLKRLHFAPQQSPVGYGDAVHCAKEFVGSEPFLLLLGDHVYLSADPDGKRCVQQVIEVAAREECAVAAVRATREHLVGRYGTVSGKRVPDQPGLYQIEKILEKPSLSRAELELQIPGLRVGHFLCFFGLHVLTHRIFEIIEEQARDNGNAEIQLTPALQALASTETFLALEVRGDRYDIGVKFGLLQAQLALGLAGEDRDRLLASLVGVLAQAHERQDLNLDT